MQPIKFNEKIGADGFLNLHAQMPMEMHGEEVEVLVQPRKSQNAPTQRSFESFAGAWVGEFSEIKHDLPEERLAEAQLQSEHDAWIDATYGSCAADPIERPDQGQWETREEIS